MLDWEQQSAKFNSQSKLLPTVFTQLTPLFWDRLTNKNVSDFVHIKVHGADECTDVRSFCLVGT